MALGSPQWMYNSGEAYEIDQSLRFDYTTDAHLSWTPTSAGNRKTWTFSFWIKRGNLSGVTGIQNIFGVTKSGGQAGSIKWGFHDDDTISIWDWHNRQLATEMLFRDSSAWYHIVLAWDTTQATDTNRVKLYVNGSQVTLTDLNAGTGWGGYPPEDDERYINATEQHCISTRNPYASDMELDVYLAEVNFIDGTALTPTSFGETGTYGEWKPVEYSGTYGTNGFYLPFKQDYTVEGFSTVTYTGNNSGQYIGGVGFQPDLTWFKRRNSTTSHAINDSVRGIETILTPNTTAAEVGGQDAGDDLLSWETDGFVLGLNGSANSHGRNNGSGNPYVAWNWDMGDGNSGTPYAIVDSGDVDHSTDQKKFGASSIHFDTSSNAGLLSVTDSESGNVFDFGSSDWTVECWLYPSFSNNRTCGIFAKRTDGGYGGYSAFLQESDGKIGIVIDSNNAGGWEVGFTSTSAISENTWSHVAWQKSGTEYSLWINGVKDATTATSSSNPYANSQDFRIGCGFDGTSQRYNGYMDDFKVFNEARWTSNFDPETSSERNREIKNALLRIQSDTTNGSTTFVDSSGAAKNTNGSITSYVAANPTYGQSIVSYTGTGSATTVGHGLSSAPEMVIVKSRDATENWVVFHTSINSGQGYIKLNSTDAATTGSSRRLRFGNDSDGVVPDSTKVYIGSGGEVNTSGNDYIAYCFHSVTGYSKFGSYSGTGSSGNAVTTGFKPAFVLIKRSDSADNWHIIDNARSPTNPHNDVLRANLSNAEAADNASFDIDTTSTGFTVDSTNSELNASGGTYIYMAFADKREYAYWLDQSGNNNDWTSNNLTESDISVDSPTNNFCTWNPLDKSSSQTLSEGNLVSDSTVNDAWKGVRGTFGISSGKWYWEYLKTNTYLHSTVGIAIADAELDVSTALSGITDWWMYSSYNGAKIGNGSETSYGATYQDVGDVVGIALDMDNGTLTFYKNGVSQGQAFNSGLSGKTVYPYRLAYNSADLTVANFGQDSSFAGNKTAQGNQDGNDIGDFYYTPPTGFLALCTSNLPAVAVTPSKHFNTVLYTADDSSDHDITGVGFQPDFVFIKGRESTADGRIYDAVRGANKTLTTTGTYAEFDESTASGLTSFDADGFNLGSNNGSWNSGSRAYVAWNWNCPTTFTPTVTSGLTSASGRSNADAGFSIVKVTADASIDNDSSYTHNLGAVPEMIITKITNSTGGWNTYHKDLGGAGKYIELNTTTAVQDATNVFETTPTSTIVKPCSNIIANGQTLVFYNFASVDGYSKVGSYTGNGATGATGQGPFVYLGFRPAFIMIKRSSSSSAYTNWVIYDSKRDGFNQGAENSGGNKYVYANSSAAEANLYIVNTFSNGFTMYDNYDVFNKSGETHIYIAFAETPFKYSNAR